MKRKARKFRGPLCCLLLLSSRGPQYVFSWTQFLFLLKTLWCAIISLVVVVVVAIAVIIGICVTALVERENDLPTNARDPIVFCWGFAETSLDLKATAIVPRLVTDIGAFRRKFILVDTVSCDRNQTWK